MPPCCALASGQCFKLPAPKGRQSPSRGGIRDFVGVAPVRRSDSMQTSRQCLGVQTAVPDPWIIEVEISKDHSLIAVEVIEQFQAQQCVHAVQQIDLPRSSRVTA